LHINGWPGVGKLTVARLLADRLDARLVHNHLIVNPAEAVFGRGDGYARLLGRLRDIMYDEMAAAAPGERFVLTDALERGDEYSEDVFRLLAVVAERRAAPLVLVALDCDAEENARRLVSPERAILGKLGNTEILSGIRASLELMRPSAEHRLDLDTTELSAASTAEVIMQFVQDRHLI